MVQNLYRYSNGIICHDPELNEEFKFIPWREVKVKSHPDRMYDIAIKILESGEYSQEEIDEEVKRANTNRRQQIKVLDSFGKYTSKSSVVWRKQRIEADKLLD